MAEHTEGAQFPNLGGGFIEPAFPVSTIDGFTQFGMTLRDYFAGQSVVAQGDNGLAFPMIVAARSYAIADAMLVERAKSSSVSGADRGGVS
jgi:hypothetical protein